MPFSELTVLPSSPGADRPLFDSSSESSDDNISQDSDYSKVATGEDSRNIDAPSEGSILTQDDVFSSDPSQKRSNQKKITTTRIMIDGIRVPPMVSPKSSYTGWEPPMKVSDEEDVLRELIVRK